MPSYNLTPEARELAIELNRLVLEKSVRRDFQFIINDNDLYSSNDSAEALEDFRLNSGDSISYAELRELVEAGLLSERLVGGAMYSFRVLPTLHDAVAANFVMPTVSAAISVDTMNVTASTLNFYGLAKDHEKLADTLVDRLLPYLQQHEAFTRIEIDGLRDAIEALRTSVDEISAEDASKRIWTYVERTSALVGILTAIALGLPK